MGASFCKKNYKKILIVGYYNRHNFGDDAFVNVFSKEWSELQPAFSNIESVTKELVEEADLIVLGGGDLLQEYFMKKIEDRILPYKKCPIYAIGVSVPFASIINTGRLDMIDKFWCRFQSDTERLKTRYGENNVFNIPDIVLAHSIPKKTIKGEYNKIGLCFSMSLARQSKNKILFDIDSLIQRLLIMNKQVYWLAFNSDTEEHESDVALYNLLPDRVKLQVPLIKEKDLLSGLVNMDLLIASRFHAHVFGYLANIPVISLLLTRKVQQWDIEHQFIDNALKLPRKCQYCDGNNPNCKGCEAFMGYPTSLPINEIIVKVKSIFKYYLNSNAKIEKSIVKKTLELISISEWTYRKNPPYFISKNVYDTKREKILLNWEKFKRGEISAEYLASIMCLLITGDANNECHYGLSSQLKEQGSNFNITASIEYIIKHHYSTYRELSLISKPNGIYNLRPILPFKNDFNHRSGWNYVLNLLQSGHNDKGIYLDTFIDRTFGWYGDYLNHLGIVPYKNDWIGFIHHPIKAIYSNNDCEHMFKKSYFIESLKTCKMLFVMSTELKEWIDSQNLNVPVRMLFHPTEFPEKKFKWDDYIKNEDKQLVQIGAWLRDPYAIFKVHSNTIQKSVLKCKDMEGYLTSEPPEILKGELSRGDGCRDIDSSPLVDSIRSTLIQQWKSVRIIDYLNNEDYDELLSKNIVLLPLLSAVAVNTLIECIARNTPVIVPRLPAVVEYLGEKYPLYYVDLKEVEKLVDDEKILRAGYKYLKGMDKAKLTSYYFIDNFNSYLSEIE